MTARNALAATQSQGRSKRPGRPGHVAVRTRPFSARVNYRVILFSLLALLALGLSPPGR